MNILITSFLLLLGFYHLGEGAVLPSPKTIIVIPGTTGSSLWATSLSNCPSACQGLPYYCNLANGPVQLFPPQVGTPGSQDWKCVSQLLQKQWLSGSVTVENNGLQVSAGNPQYDFGYDPSCTSFGLERLWDTIGYTFGKNRFNACYDWRQSPVDLATNGFWNDLQNLILYAYQSNGNTKVTLVAESFGSIVIHALMSQNSKTEDFSTQFIDRVIHLGGGPGGTTVLAALFIATYSGAESVTVPMPNSGITVDYPVELLQISMLNPGGAWATPNSILYPNNEILMTVDIPGQPSQQFTAETMISQGLDGWLDALPQFSQTEQMINALYAIESSMSDGLLITPPVVPTDFILGYGIPTIYSVTYPAGYTTQSIQEATFTYQTGDGFINYGAVENIVQQWQANSPVPINIHRVEGVFHNDYLQTVETNELVLQLANARPCGY